MWYPDTESRNNILGDSQTVTQFNEEMSARYKEEKGNPWFGIERSVAFLIGSLINVRYQYNL